MLTENINDTRKIQVKMTLVFSGYLSRNLNVECEKVF